MSAWAPLPDSDASLSFKVDLANGPSRVAVTVFDGQRYACEAINPGREWTEDQWADALGRAATRCVRALSRAMPAPRR